MKDKSKAAPGPFKDVVDGLTDHGGCFTVTYYFDNRYKPIAKEKASRAIVHEYDEKSRSVYRDYLTMEKGIPVRPKVNSDKPEEISDSLEPAL